MPSKAALIAEAMARNGGLAKQAEELVRRDFIKRGLLKAAGTTDDVEFTGVKPEMQSWMDQNEKRIAAEDAAKPKPAAPSTPAASAAAPAPIDPKTMPDPTLKDTADEAAPRTHAPSYTGPIDPNKFKATGWNAGLSRAADVTAHPVSSLNEATSTGWPAVAKWTAGPVIGAAAAHGAGNAITDAATRGAPKMPGAIGAIGRVAGNLTGVRPLSAVVSHPINTVKSVGDAGSAVKRLMTPTAPAAAPVAQTVQRAAPVATSALEDAASAQAAHATEQAAARLPQRAGAFGARAAVQRVVPTTPMQQIAAGKTPVMSLEQLGGKELPAAARAAEGGMARRMYGSTLRAGEGLAERAGIGAAEGLATRGAETAAGWGAKRILTGAAGLAAGALLPAGKLQAATQLMGGNELGVGSTPVPGASQARLPYPPAWGPKPQK